MTADRAWTPAGLAKRYGVGIGKILGWIQRRELEAVNVAANPNGRPRWAILPEAVTAFEQARAAQATPKTTRRRKKAESVMKFF